MSDSLSNFFSHLKNAQKNHILIIEHSKSKVILSILKTLQECGYIRGYRLNKTKALDIKTNNFESTQKIEILLKYKNQKPAINQILRISKPSKRIYLSVRKLINSPIKQKSTLKQLNANINPLIFMKGIYILSTSKGIMSHLTAFRLNIGGEVLCHVS